MGLMNCAEFGLLKWINNEKLNERNQSAEYLQDIE